MSREQAPFSRDSRAVFAETLVQVRNTLSFMADLGCRGFDLSEEALDILDRLGTIDRPQTPKQPERQDRPAAAKRKDSPAESNSREKPKTRSESIRPEFLKDIQGDLGDCRRCKLCERRTHIVFGTGNAEARLMFVGEGPGRDEDLQGEPFVGAAGRLLTKIIQAIQLTREEVYIANIIKCRPPGNRNPEPEEIRTCYPFLERQIQAIRPEFICALGSFAARTLLSTTQPISRLRGRFHDYKGIKVVPTFHPAFLLRNPERKRDVWEDMKMLMREMGHEI
ncbi:MAG: uracil-DNA glycosylase [Thermodesulfobacteriota bacterium]